MEILNLLSRKAIQFCIPRRLGAALTAVVVFSGCSMFDTSYHWDYLESSTTPELVIPPDINAERQSPEKTKSYEVWDLDVAEGTNDKEELKKLELPPDFDAGVDEQAFAAADTPTQAKGVLNVRAARNTDGYDLLVVEAKFDDVWDRVGESLKSIGFVVEDSNRGEGIYAIHQVIHKKLTEEEEFLRPRFDKGLREEYQVHVEDRDEQSRITVRNTSGKIDDSALAKHLLVQLKANLSRDTEMVKKKKKNKFAIKPPEIDSE